MGGVGEELAAFDEELCSRFLRMLPEEINTIRSPNDQRGKARLREAQVFFTNYQLHAWVSKQNECHGIAPTVGDTLVQRDELAAASVGNSDAPPIWSVAGFARYKWAAKFRRKWRLGSRKPQAREAVPLEVARKKAQLRRKGCSFQHIFHAEGVSSFVLLFFQRVFGFDGSRDARGPC